VTIQEKISWYLKAIELTDRRLKAARAREDNTYVAYLERQRHIHKANLVEAIKHMLLEDA
jgi:hypothetical protein